MGRPKGSKNASKETIVRPMIEVNGDVHPMKDLEQNGEMPILKSVGMGKMSPNDKGFVYYIITSRGTEVLNMEISDSVPRYEAEDLIKVGVVNLFLNVDGPVAG